MTTLTEQVQKFARKNGISGYEGVVFGRSQHNQNYPSAVRFAERNGGRLQSLKDAVVYRFASNGKTGSVHDQYTSDFALYFRLGGVNKVVFVDGYDFVDRQNRSLISRCQEGLNTSRRNRNWYLPYSEFSPHRDDGVGVWLDELVETGLGKLFDVGGSLLRIQTKKPSEEGNGKFYFGNFPLITSLLTPRIAEAYSEYLSTKFRSWKGVNFLFSIEFADIPEGTFFCRPVFLEKMTSGSISATGKFADEFMYARGVIVPELEVSK